MAQYVKISKSKNLRYQLVSILYLLFITLTLLQIPTDWLRVNSKISADFMNVSADDDISDVQLSNAIKEVERLQNEFIALSKIQKDPTGYKTTDEFFINQKKGAQLFSIIYELHEYYEKTANKAYLAKFDQLFKDDLMNGLSTGEFNKWMEWKFKNVPGSVAQLLINEILVRCHLMHGALAVSKPDANNLVELAFNINELHLGDTALLVLNAGYVDNFEVLFGKNSTSEFNKVGDSIYFTPKKVGKYTLSATGVDKSTENLEIQVLPMTISGSNGSSNEKKIQYFFQGKPSQITSKAITEGSKFKLVGGDWEQVRVSNGKIEFLPTKPGWNVLKLESSAGALYLEDSVFVYPTPTPIIDVEKASNNKINLEQLKNDGVLKLRFFHPTHTNISYVVEKVVVNFIGAKNKIQEYNSNLISVDQNIVSNTKFILVKNVKLRTRVGNIIELNEPILIEIN